MNTIFVIQFYILWYLWATSVQKKNADSKPVEHIFYFITR